MVSDMVERCEEDKKENEKCLKEIKVKVDMMQKEIDHLKESKEAAAKQCHFDGNQVRNCLIFYSE